MNNYDSVIWFIEEYLCHYNVMAMCYESYHASKFGDAFENPFLEFEKYLDEFNNMSDNLKPEDVEFNLKSNLRIKREEAFKKYSDFIYKSKMNSNELIEEYLELTKDFKNSNTPYGKLEIQLGLPTYMLNKLRGAEES